MKKVLTLAAATLALVVFTSAAFAHGCHNGGGRGHNWRQDGNGGYYCDGGYGHGSHCRY